LAAGSTPFPAFFRQNFSRAAKRRIPVAANVVPVNPVNPVNETGARQREQRQCVRHASANSKPPATTVHRIKTTGIVVLISALDHRLPAR
jgi:hypothetical protein